MRAARITEHPTDMTVARNDPVTLKCSAEGNPEPTIEWYRDGELILSSNGNGNGNGNGPKSAGNSHRVILPGGDLFFFRVVQGRKESDAGVYWCLARNPQGSSRSRNATLTVACKSRHSIYLFVCFSTSIIIPPWECATTRLLPFPTVPYRTVPYRIHSNYTDGRTDGLTE